MQKAPFFHQFAALLTAGLPLGRSLAMAAQERGAQTFLQQASRRVEQGESLTQALQGRRSPFTPWELSLLHLGETSGALVAVSQQLAHQAEVHQRRARLYGASLVAVGMVAVLLGLGLAVLLVGAEPVLAPQVLWGVIALLIAALILKGQVQWSGDLGQWEQALMRHVPGFKGLGESRSQTHLAELSLPLRCGLPMDRALELVRPRVRDPLLAKALGSAAAQVRRGKPLSQCLMGRVPPITLQMIRTGEETGTLDTMLEQLGEYYEGELERQLRQLEGILRPLSLVAMGLLVLLLGLQMVAQGVPALDR